MHCYTREAHPVMSPQPFCAKLAQKLAGLEDQSRVELVDLY